MSGMTCQSIHGLILDLARDVAIPAPSLGAVDEHLRRCDACRVELERQRELTAGLRAIAAEGQQWTAPARLEARVLGGFGKGRQESPSPGVPAAIAARGVGRHPWARYAGATAALIVCALWIGMRQARPQPQPAVPPVADAAPRAPHVGLSRAATTTAPIVAETVARPGRPGRRTAKPAAARPVRAVEFVVLPDALGLPAFESGTIVRVEVPVAELPAYGLKIPPDVSRSNVEADVLVGQDGQARAIRLVSEPDSSRSRR